VGFDDFELADVLGVTVMRSDPGLMGERAAGLAFARLDGDDRPPQRLTIPTTLIVRGSGEVAP
jgi:LacI family transcriptional regulator